MRAQYLILVLFAISALQANAAPKKNKKPVEEVPDYDEEDGEEDAEAGSVAAPDDIDAKFMDLIVTIGDKLEHGGTNIQARKAVEKDCRKMFTEYVHYRIDNSKVLPAAFRSSAKGLAAKAIAAFSDVPPKGPDGKVPLSPMQSVLSQVVRAAKKGLDENDGSREAAEKYARREYRAILRKVIKERVLPQMGASAPMLEMVLDGITGSLNTLTGETEELTLGSAVMQIIAAAYPPEGKVKKGGKVDKQRYVQARRRALQKATEVIPEVIQQAVHKRLGKSFFTGVATKAAGIFIRQILPSPDADVEQGDEDPSPLQQVVARVIKSAEPGVRENNMELAKHDALVKAKQEFENLLVQQSGMLPLGGSYIAQLAAPMLSTLDLYIEQSGKMAKLYAHETRKPAKKPAFEEGDDEEHHEEHDEDDDEVEQPKPKKNKKQAARHVEDDDEEEHPKPKKAKKQAPAHKPPTAHQPSKKQLDRANPKPKAKKVTVR